MVGPPGFEPGTSCTPSKRASQAAPRPDVVEFPFYRTRPRTIADPPVSAPQAAHRSSRSKSMTCPSCGATMRFETDQASFNCAYCGSDFLPEANADGVRPLGEPSTLPCPVCAIPLVQAVAGDRRMFYCTGCRGMLIPMEFFPAIIQMLRAQRQTGGAVVRPIDPKDLERHDPLSAVRPGRWMRTPTAVAARWCWTPARIVR